MLSPETLTAVKEGGVPVLLMIAIVWLAADRNRLIRSIAEKDALIGEKDDKLAALSERTIVTMIEFKTLLQSVADLLVKRR
jgi:uncharacterized membrane protein